MKTDLGLSVKKFFVWLICLNGLITIVLSMVILADIWTHIFSDDTDTFMKIVVSYIILLLNFSIFGTMYAKIKDRGTDGE